MTALAGLSIADPPSAWEALGFAVDGGRCAVGATALELGAEGRGIVSWTLRGDRGRADVDGIATAWSAQDVAAATHPNGAVAVDHVVVRTPDLARTFAALEGVGMRLRRERDAGGGVRQGFFRHGEAIVEVVGPLAPDGGGPAALWGLVVVVADVDALADRLGARLGQVKDAVQPGRRIVTVRRDAGVSVPLAFITPEL